MKTKEMAIYRIFMQVSDGDGPGQSNELRKESFSELGEILKG